MYLLLHIAADPSSGIAIEGYSVSFLQTEHALSCDEYQASYSI